MVRRKRKKCVKYRGQTNHGWGHKKKHRGAGNRAGRGNAGYGKRCHSKKPSIDISEYFGKHGFKSIKKIKQRAYDAINILDLDRKLPELVSSKKAEAKSGVYHVDLKKLGYAKLLGLGETKNNYQLMVSFASKSAIEKIEKAGGKVELPVKKAEKPAKAQKAEKPVQDAKAHKEKDKQ